MAYRKEFLAANESLLKLRLNRLLQSASMMVVMVTSILLFEISFIGGAFPETLSEIDVPRYAPCLSVLAMANFVLVLAMALLLKVITWCEFPYYSESYYRNELSVVGTERHLQNRLIAHRYKELLAMSRSVILLESQIEYARRIALIGLNVGMLSAVLLLVNGRLFNKAGIVIQPDNETILFHACWWVALAVGVFLACVIAYVFITRPLRTTGRVVKVGGPKRFMQKGGDVYRLRVDSL